MADETANYDSDTPKEVNFEGQTLTNCDFAGVTFKSANFEGATFTEPANFQGATFTEEGNFDRAIFTEGGNFDRATFTGPANFEGATFNKVTSFVRTTFTGEGNFNGASFANMVFFAFATFTERANFQGATFTEQASFQNATFEQWVRFEGATFTVSAVFVFATFVGRANFSGATIGWAFFDGATFTEEGNFEGATFTGLVNFVNAKMKAETSFAGVSFASEPPRFFGAKLHEGTVWRGVVWPDPPRDTGRAGRFVDAYERLKLEMDRLKKHEDELDFFARELQCRRVLQGTWRGFPIAIYGALSDYGRSYVRPLVGLLIIVAVGAVPLWTHLGGLTLRPLAYMGHAREALGLSFANTFSVLGIRKELIAAKVLEALPGWLKVIATAQTAFGIVLLFLLGLGIRNRFRMR